MSVSFANIVVLAGGVSSRMKRSTTAGISSEMQTEAAGKSKAMIGVGTHRRPFLDYLFWNIQEAGYQSVVIVVCEQDSGLRRYYEEEQHEREFPRLRFSYIVQPIPPGRTKPLGTADALSRALQVVPEWDRAKFTVCNSDNLYSVGALQRLLEDGHANCMIDYDRSGLKFDSGRIAQFAVIQKDADGYLTTIIEKPSADQMTVAGESSGRIGVSMNIFRFSYRDIYPFLLSVPLHPSRDEKELPLAVNMMIQSRPKSVFTIPRSEHVIDLTTQADIPEVQTYLRRAYAGTFLSE